MLSLLDLRRRHALPETGPGAEEGRAGARLEDGVPAVRSGHAGGRAEVVPRESCGNFAFIIEVFAGEDGPASSAGVGRLLSEDAWAPSLVSRSSAPTSPSSVDE